MKRSRRVVLQMMGLVAVTTATTGFRRAGDCAPVEPFQDGRLERRPAGNCQASFGGFGAAHRRFQFSGGG